VTTYPASSNIRPRHGSAPYNYTTAYTGLTSPTKRLNVGYVDGHVAGLPYQDLKMNNANAVEWRAGMGATGCACQGAGCSTAYCNGL
jgi:prepilin-type processing-associated H-X9-DG protein